MKLAGDMAQLEMALAPIQSLKDLGGPYKELRALRPLLFRENDQILGSPELSSLSLCTVMHHMFSRAPEELLSPHVSDTCECLCVRERYHSLLMPRLGK